MKQPTPANIAKYGRPGDPIPGSQLLRSYCRSCAEPIRVVDHTMPQDCVDCRKVGIAHPTQGVPGPRRHGQGVGCWKGK